MDKENLCDNFQGKTYFDVKNLCESNLQNSFTSSKINQDVLDIKKSELGRNNIIIKESLKSSPKLKNIKFNESLLLKLPPTSPHDINEYPMLKREIVYQNEISKVINKSTNTDNIPKDSKRSVKTIKPLSKYSCIKLYDVDYKNYFKKK